MFQPTPFLSLLMRQRNGTAWQASNEGACHAVDMEVLQHCGEISAGKTTTASSGGIPKRAVS
jgi:hypothetical protein